MVRMKKLTPKSKAVAIFVSLNLLCLSEAGEVKFELVNLVDDIYIECPADISITKNFPVEDFMLADMSRDGQSFLRAYVGNGPKFPSSTCSGLVEQRVMKGLPAKEIKCSNEDFASDVLVYLDLDWPRYVHFMLRGTSTEHQSMGFLIISSLHLRGKP